MVPILAYRMQEAVHGGLSRTARTRLQRLIDERPTSSARVRKERSASQPASKLIRSWGGEIHEVLITPEGYIYRGETYRKLSPIAKTDHWNPVVRSCLLRYPDCGEDAMNSKVVRCAVYTRKSSEEGLDQSFNSLHAQREACEAYVLSQKHEGWEVIQAEYDDGGFSGGNMDRPGLKKLLMDIAARRVDTVVVYKVDRLTRSLADFRQDRGTVR